MSTSQRLMCVGHEHRDSSPTQSSNALIPPKYRAFALAAAITVLGLVLAACSGAVGDTGEQGPTGAVGAVGEKGDTGPAGPTGERGETGSAGAHGDSGPQGPKSDAGPVGLQGPAGPVGTPGPAGAPGLTGDPGPAGERGPAGPIGPAGLTGDAEEVSEVGSANETAGRALPPSANTIEIVDSANSVGFDTSITIGTDGFPIISYRDGTGGDLKFVHCGSASCSEDNTIVLLDSEDVVGFDTSIAVGADGLPVISYRDFTNDSLKVAHCGTTDCTTGNAIVTVDDQGRVGEGTSIAIGTDGLPIISFRDVLSDQLRVVHCGDVSCSDNNLTFAIDENDFGGFQSSIAIGADGLPIIAYRVGTTDLLRIVHCGNVRCSKDNLGRTLDPAGDVGFTPSLTIGIDGLPIVAYKTGITSNLKFIRCEDVLCVTKGDPVTLDARNLAGFDPSVTIAADGLPIISYQDASSEDLVLIHCGDIGCTSGVVRNVVVGLSAAGSDSSMTIGVDGLPIIAYLAATDSDLAVVHLSNSYGVPYFRAR